MPHVILVDSAFKKRGTDSDFSFELNETLSVSDARMRLDKISFVNSFYTVANGVNQYIYIYTNEDTQTWHAIPQQAYTAKQLATAIQVATGFTSTYFEPRNEIRITVPDAFTVVMADAELGAMPPSPLVSWPQGATPINPMSLNNVSGPRAREGNDVVFAFLNMSIYHEVYHLRSNRLACHNTHGPGGDSDIIARIPINKGVATIIEDSTPDGVYLDLCTHSLRTLDFRLTDNKGNVVDLRNNQLSLQLTID